MSSQTLGTCHRCGRPIYYPAKPDVDYIIIPGFGFLSDQLWHMQPCALAENADPKSKWFKILIPER